MIFFPLLGALVAADIIRDYRARHRVERAERAVRARLVPTPGPRVFYAPAWEWAKHDAAHADPSKLFHPPRPSGPRPPGPGTPYDKETLAWFDEQDRLDAIDRK